MHATLTRACADARWRMLASNGCMHVAQHAPGRDWACGRALRALHAAQPRHTLDGGALGAGASAGLDVRRRCAGCEAGQGDAFSFIAFFSSCSSSFCSSFYFSFLFIMYFLFESVGVQSLPR